MTALAKACSFQFKEPDWLSKFLIGGMFMIPALAGLGIPVVGGYCLRTTQRVMHREKTMLPAWTDVGVMFVVGFKWCVVNLLTVPYSILKALLMPIITFRFAERERIPDPLDVATVFKSPRANWRDPVVIALIWFALGLLAPLGFSFFLLGIFVTSFYAYVVMGFLSGELNLARAHPEGGF